MPETDKEMVLAIAEAFADYLNDALYIDEVPAQTLAPVVVEVFGESPTEDTLLKEASLKAQFQRLPKALNQALDTDQVDSGVVFQAINHAIDEIFYDGTQQADEHEFEDDEYGEDDDLSGPEWVEKHLGAKLPKALVEAYENGDADELEDIIVDEGDLYISVTEFNSLSANGYRSVWPGTEGRLILARDGAGNEYQALPKEKFKKVYFFDHETGEIEPLGLDIPGFLDKLREYNDE